MNRTPHTSTHITLRAPGYWLQAMRAFTLIEMMVAVSIFAIVMMVGIGALLSLVETNHRAQAINSVMNNLNAALEGMSRSIRVGSTYHCSANPDDTLNLTQTQDCSNGGGRLLAIESSTGDITIATDQVVYRLKETRLERSLQSGANGTWVAITAPEVSIDTFDFYVVGSSRGDGIQPRVLMRIKGSAKVPRGTTEFTVQASVVERLLDI